MNIPKMAVVCAVMAAGLVGAATSVTLADSLHDGYGRGYNDDNSGYQNQGDYGRRDGRDNRYQYRNRNQQHDYRRNSEEEHH